VGDGNGWIYCRCGGRHWGVYGAAGILVTDGSHVLLQHRAAWTHQGGSWALPGGARDSHETPLQAALREAAEETSLDGSALTPFDEWVDDHGPWRYTTVLAHSADRPEVRPVNAESDAVRWWPIDGVPGLRLHTGFAAAWPNLRERIARASLPDRPETPLP